MGVVAPAENLVAFGNPIDAASLNQIKEILMHPEAVRGALMADHHKGYSIPIGGVVAFEDAISPNGVGYDIACGNMAVRTNVRLAELAVHVYDDGMKSEELIVKAVRPIMQEIERKVAFGLARVNETPLDHSVLDLGQNIWLDIVNAFGADLHKRAVAQLGTVGSGNHYVDLLVDEHGYIWIANHFGSRGLGHTLASGFLAQHYGLGWREKISDAQADTPVIFSTKSDIGQFYIEAMKLAGRYAYAGREYVIEQVVEILGAKVTFSVHNHHNFAWFENGLWVVRKGATPLTEDYAFIGGSMGDDSYIVRGKTPDPSEGHEQMLDSLYGRVIDLGNLGSAPHGAGRVMSRTQAAGRMTKSWHCSDCGWMQLGGPRPETCDTCGGDSFRKHWGRDANTGQVDWKAVRESLTNRGIVVVGAGADEAPEVYKRLDEVLAHHENIEVAHRLSPIGVVMAGPNDFDPYKD
jgi:tRNA-splicing ligase RtcB